MAFSPLPSANLQAAADAAGRVSDRPRGNFVFGYHPEEWQMDVAGRLVPVIVHLSRDPGINGVGPDGSFRSAKVQYEERGYVLIPHDVLGDTDYVAPYLNKKGAKVHRTLFQTGYNDATGNTQWAFDQEAWDAFIDLLRERGVIAQPRPEVLHGLLEQVRQTLANKRIPRSDDQSKVDSYNMQCDLLKAQIATLEREHVKSVQVHGQGSSPGRSVVLELLGRQKAADIVAAPAADAVRAKLKSRKVAEEPAE